MSEVVLKNLSDEQVAIVVVSTNDLEVMRTHLENVLSTLNRSSMNTSYERRCISELIDKIDHVLK